MRQIRQYAAGCKGMHYLFEANAALLLELLVFVVAPAQARRLGWLLRRCVFYRLLCQNISFSDNGQCRRVFQK
jgi:hypothetical protein